MRASSTAAAAGVGLECEARVRECRGRERKVREEREEQHGVGLLILQRGARMRGRRGACHGDAAVVATVAPLSPQGRR